MVFGKEGLLNMGLKRIKYAFLHRHWWTCLWWMLH